MLHTHYTLSPERGRLQRVSPPSLSEPATELSGESFERQQAKAGPFKLDTFVMLGSAALLGLSLVPGQLRAQHPVEVQTVETPATDGVDLQETAQSIERGVFRLNERGLLRPDLPEPRTPEEAETYHREQKKADTPNTLLKDILQKTDVLIDLDNSSRDLNSEKGVVALYTAVQHEERSRMLHFDPATRAVQSYAEETLNYVSYQPGAESLVEASFTHTVESHPERNREEQLSLVSQVGGQVGYRYEKRSSTKPDSELEKLLPSTGGEPGSFEEHANGTLRPATSEPRTLKDTRDYGRKLSEVAGVNQLIEQTHREIAQLKSADNTERDLNSEVGLVVTHQDYGKQRIGRRLNYDPTTGDVIDYHTTDTLNLEQTSLGRDESYQTVQGYRRVRERVYRPGQDRLLTSTWQRTVESDPKLNRTFVLEVEDQGSGLVVKPSSQGSLESPSDGSHSTSHQNSPGS
jgi:hypothetical protein